MSNYISDAANVQRAQDDLLSKIKSPADVIAVMKIDAVFVDALFPDAIKKAVADYELDQLRTALYTYLRITP